MTKLEEIISCIKGNSVYVQMHNFPDPDAIASQIALRDSIKLTFPEKKVYAVGAGVHKFKYLGSLGLPVYLSGFFLYSLTDAKNDCQFLSNNLKVC